VRKVLGVKKKVRKCGEMGIFLHECNLSRGLQPCDGWFATTF
jgi:hypothetical protein